MNRLSGETSPYLQQHAENPVDWYPWGEEATLRARREDKPILLSIGYSACHWCHVMAHESFADPRTAAVMNERFVNVKVDREERPDLDEIYMTATQLATRHGGWPMTVFLTPELEPFFCGTYFPDEPRHGMPSFRQILEQVSELWRTRRDLVGQATKELVEGTLHLSTVPPSPAGGEALSHRLVENGARALLSQYDPEHGGFGGAPKFPQAMSHLLLLRHWKRTGETRALTAVENTCDRMARGGIHDHLGGGFHRYSVDERWLVPHFEKMLYDNALLARVYVEAAQATGREDFLAVARGTLDYVLRDMTSPSGGFYSSEDADSEGEEGRFYVWTPDEIREAVGDERLARIVGRWYGVTPGGNFEHGTTILTRSLEMKQCAYLVGEEDPEEVAPALEEGRRRLFEARAKRVRPGRDEKVLAGWTGLMAGAFARGFQATGDPRYRETAGRALSFVLSEMRAGGRLSRTWRDGKAKIDGFLEDHAFVLEALVVLYEATFDPAWIERALSLADETNALFWDDQDGGFFYTAAGRRDLIVRSKHPYENAIPSGNSAAAHALARLARLSGRKDLAEKAERTFLAFLAGMEQAPAAFSYLLSALDFHLAPPREVVLAGPDDASLAGFRGVLARRYDPHLVVAGETDDGEPEVAERTVPLLAGKSHPPGRAGACVCRDFACFPFSETPEDLEKALEG
ncbi:MAG: thioredoxin domain-containing protein [Planctomycetes bacterium]|nr:thioredoxin domain-containing protein [Planctomycetota bacterium]